MELNKVYLGDSLEVLITLPDESIDCCVTSPPYYALRDYGTGTWEGGDPNCDHEAARKKTRFDYAFNSFQDGSKGTDVKEYAKVCPICGARRVDRQIGLEDTPEEYIEKMTALFAEVRRVLKKEGTLWVNIGDSYNGQGAGKNPGGLTRKAMERKGKDYEDTVVRTGKKVVGSCKPKDLIGIPWMLAFALRSDGWYLRQDIIWHKPNPMPESVTDRCTKSHEYIFLLSKSERYYFDNEAIQEEAVTQLDPRIGNRIEYNGMRDGEKGKGQRSFVSLKFGKMGGNKYGDSDDPHFATKSGKEWQPQMRWGSGTKTERTHEQNYSKDENGGHRDNSGGFDCEMSVKDGVVVRNKRDVWTINVKPNKEAHFATYPEELIAPCILAGCPEGGTVLDPFMGSGTTGIVARKLSRNYVGIELNPEYHAMAERRIASDGDNLFSDY